MLVFATAKTARQCQFRAVFTDFCQYGCRWRKRTKLLCGNLDAQDVARLEKLCTGRGLCSRTHLPHLQLTGSNHQGIPWTRIAQPYPTGLCRDLAFTLTSPSHPCWRTFPDLGTGLGDWSERLVIPAVPFSYCVLSLCGDHSAVFSSDIIWNDALWCQRGGAQIVSCCGNTPRLCWESV